MCCEDLYTRKIWLLRVSFLLYLPWLICGSLVLNKYADQEENTCAELWTFCLIYLVVISLAELSHFYDVWFYRDDDHHHTSFLTKICTLATLGLFVWSVILKEKTLEEHAIWINGGGVEVNATCADYYADQAWYLLVLFEVIFWWSVSILCIIGFICCISCTIALCVPSVSDGPTGCSV